MLMITSQTSNSTRGQERSIVTRRCQMRWPSDLSFFMPNLTVEAAWSSIHAEIVAHLFRKVRKSGQNLQVIKIMLEGICVNRVMNHTFSLTQNQTHQFTFWRLVRGEASA